VQEDIDKLNSFYMNFKVWVKDPIVGDDEAPKQVVKINGVEGSAYTRPTNNCYDLKRMFPQKKSGYYWVKGGCQVVPNRMFCDFVSSTDFLYVGSTSKNIVWNDKVDKSQVLKDECAKFGLYPVHITNI